MVKKIISTILVTCIIASFAPVCFAQKAEIIGPDVIYAPSEGQYAYISYMLDGGADAYIWQVSGDSAKAYAASDRYIGINGKSGDFILNAVSESDKSIIASKEVSVSEIGFDFEKYGGAGVRPSVGNLNGIAEWENYTGNLNAVIAVEENGNKYLNASAGTNCSGVLGIKNAISGGTVTVDASVLYKQGADSENLIRLRNSSGQWAAQVNMNSGNWSCGSNKDIYMQNEGTWADIRFVINLDEAVYSVYAKAREEQSYGAPIVENAEYAVGSNSRDLKSLVINTPVDNLRIFSGVDPLMSADFSFSGSKRFTRAYGNEESVIKIKTELEYNGEPVNEPVSCSTDTDYDGMRIDGNNICLTSDAPDSIDLRFSAFGGLSEKLLTLEIDDCTFVDFENQIVGEEPNGFVSNGASVDEEELNKYLSVKGTASINLLSPDEASVISFKIRKKDVGVGTVKIGSLNLSINNDGNTCVLYADDNTNAITLSQDEWNSFIYRYTSDGRSTVLVNDKALMFDEQTADMPAAAVEFSGTDADDIYSGSPLMLVPCAVQLSADGSPAALLTLTADYKFFSSFGDEEAESEIKWYISDRPDSEPTLAGYGKTFKIPQSAVGKRVYFSVLPKGKRMAGDVVYSEPIAVRGILDAEFSENGIKVNADNVWGEPKDIIIGVSSYKKGVCCDISVMRKVISTDGTAAEFITDTTCDKYIITVLESESLIPLAVKELKREGM